MTAMFLLAATFVVSTAGLLDLRRDTRQERERIEVERITAALPVARMNLTEEWPQRQSPTDLDVVYHRPAMYHSKAVGGMTWLTTGYLEPRLYIPWPEIRDRLYAERRRLAAIVTPTAEFNEIVARNFTDWWCPSCRGDEEYGKAHEECNETCACPCSLAEVTSR